MRLAERAAQRAGQIGLILDDEHSHGFLRGAARRLARVFGFILDAEVVEHHRRVAAGPDSDAGAGARQAVALAEHADAAEIHANLSALLENLQRVPRVGIELEVVLALEPDAIAVDDAVHRELLLREIELRRIVVHRVLIFPHQARRASAADRLEAHRHLNILILRARKNGNRKTVGEATACPRARGRARVPSRFTVHPSGAASRPAAIANPGGRRTDLVVVERAQDHVLRRHGSLEKQRQRQQQHACIEIVAPAG